MADWGSNQLLYVCLPRFAKKLRKAYTSEPEGKHHGKASISFTTDIINDFQIDYEYEATRPVQLVNLSAQINNILRTTSTMFSPAANTGAASASTRTSRRRPRPASQDSISQPKAKRQRSVLNEQTFVALDAATEMENVKTTKSTALAIAKRESSRLSQTPRRELTVRGKKSKPSERISKGDGSVPLTTNENFTVSRLAAWPDRLQADPKGRLHGAVYSDTGYALSLTPTHALVWPYASNNASPETFVFALPQASKSVSDSLPLGSLVSASASSAEPGLVVVMPSGKVTFWESVASAATLDLIQQQRHGVELTIPGMYSGETVIQVLNAESAGFVLGFSSGRLAYMSVRDGQGRPGIAVQFLRGGSGPVSTGIFGSIRNVLSSAGLRGDLAAVRAGPSNKSGERAIVTATAKGRLQIWDLLRGGHNTLQADSETRESIAQAFRESDHSLGDLNPDSFEILDAAFMPVPAEDYDSTAMAGVGAPLLLLVSMGVHNVTHYALVQVRLSRSSFDIGLIRHLRTYTTPVDQSATSRPRLHLPAPATVAFVVFDRAAVIVSITQPSVSANSQLLSDVHIAPQHFEDVIDFRRDSGVEIVGSGAEEPYVHQSADEARSRRYRAKTPSVLLLVRGGGVLRIAASTSLADKVGVHHVVTARSKLEQAVFYGVQDKNFLNFRGRSEITFSPEDVAEACLDLSRDIISSKSTHIPSAPGTVDLNLKQRSAALRTLAVHLKTIDAQLNRRTRWELLWMAEKVQAATKVWARYDAQLQDKPVGQKKGIFNDIVLCIHEDYKTQPLAEAGELDRIRHWFIHDIYRFEIAIPWAFQVIKYNYHNGEKDHASVMSLISEADDFIISAMSAAFEFREQNLALYGLEGESLHNGILTRGYEGLPEFWTSTRFVSDNLRRQTDLSGQMALEYYETDSSSAEGAPNARLVNKVRIENPQMVDLSTTSTTERHRWLQAQQDPKEIEAGKLLEEASMEIRETQIQKLADLDLSEQAIQIAVKHRVFLCLATLLIEELLINQANAEEYEKHRHHDGRSMAVARANAAKAERRIQGYITDFGADFASALYTYYLKRGELHALISDETGKSSYLTQFLRSQPALRKLTWINEIKVNKDFDRAAQALLSLGHGKEPNIWNKKVELSLGKLARLAGKKYSQAEGLIIPDGGETELVPTNNKLAVIKIQEEVYLRIHPAIKAAIDENAEQQLALEAFGNKSLAGKAGLPELLEEKIIKLISQEFMTAAELVDLLTLMNTGHDSGSLGILDGEEYFYALRALKVGQDDQEERDIAERVLWRRCLIRDDWTAINNTASKNDQDVHHQLQHTALYNTLRTCIEKRFFEKPSTFSPMSPSSVLGSSTTSLGPRFAKASPSVQADILSDMAAEDLVLSQYIEKAQLEKWFSNVLELAKQSVEEEMNAETENGVAMKDMAKELENVEAAIREREVKRAAARLKGKARYRPGLSVMGSVMGNAGRRSLRITG